MKCFSEAVRVYGNPEAKAPSGTSGKDRYYVSVWQNPYLAEVLYKQWKYFRAKNKGQNPPRVWFWIQKDDQTLTDWKTTAKQIINAEYTGNASYEWFDWEETESGERVGRRVNYFERIKDVSDPRLDNPALDYLFSHPELGSCTALARFKCDLRSGKLDSSLKKN